MSLEAINTAGIMPQGFNQSYFARFIDYTDRKKTTVKGYITCLRQFAVWLNKNNITHPQREDIKAYREHLEQSSFAAGTQQQYLRAVKHFFKWTAAEGLYPNIADNVHGVKVRHDLHKKDALSGTDVRKIAETIDRSTEQGKRLYAMFLLCVTCGLRCIEIHRANIEDIKKNGSRVYLYIQGKGRDEKDAPVLLVEEVRAAIDDYLNIRKTPRTPKSPLFTATSNRSKGGRIAETTISTMIKNMLVNAGYDSDRITAHSLRHTSGTAAYKATGDIYQAQKHQRHTDPATTEIYIHAAEREERNTEQQVYDFLFTGEETAHQRALAIQLINSLDAARIVKVIDYINSL